MVHTSNPNVNQNIVYLPMGLVEQGLSVDGQVSKVIIRLENKERWRQHVPPSWKGAERDR